VPGAAGHAAPGTASTLGTSSAAVSGPDGDGPVETAAPAMTEAFTYVEKMPEFAGGQAALLRYLREHLRYPSQALREQAEGRVFMSFVVRADGTIAEATVLKGLGYGLDEEALRVVRQMPAWTPGYQAQHAVAVRFTLPISFKIQ
ncbi:MAG: energy transducer TonB, partial [Hymenobacter sp.]